MKKHFTAGQIVCIIVICLLVEVVSNPSYVIKEIKDGWNRGCAVATK